MNYDKKYSRLKHFFQQGAFNDTQKDVISTCLIYGLDDEEIDVLLDDQLSAEQMKRCMYGFMYGLSIEDVEKYAKKCYSIEVMDQIRYSLIKKSERRLVAYLLKGDFDERQMLEIRKGNDLPDMYIELYAVPCYTAEQMKEIRLGFQHGLSLKHIYCYIDSRFSEIKMNMIRRGLEGGISINDALEFSQPDLPDESLYNAIKMARDRKNKCSKLDLLR